MPRSNLPTYAIVELLIRLEKHNPAIGGYKNHTEFDEGVMVKTSGGSIEFPKELVEQQFNNPERISEKVLEKTALLFRN
ncbi:MAG: hypothetical protein JST50_07265 [Bacteroidetes bacterium]|jgi:hypothetical protein|nr:hypothetical protein [Bacteroidota bacterium]